MELLGFDHVWVDEMGSVIGVKEGVLPGPTLLLDGHCDTVNANSPDWSHDPWGGMIENGHLFGRGAADMKGSLAAMIHAAGAFDRSKLNGRVFVSATVSEEVAEGGALKSVIDTIHPDYVVIGEATQLHLNRGALKPIFIRFAATQCLAALGICLSCLQVQHFLLVEPSLPN